MNCPKCGHPLRRPAADGHFVCYECGWEREEDEIKPPARTMWGIELLKTRREIATHLIVSLTIFLTPIVSALILSPLLATYYPLYRSSGMTEFADLILQYYLPGLGIYLVLSFILNIQPNPDNLSVRGGCVGIFLTIGFYLIALVFMPGKWLFLALYSIYWNRRDSRAAKAR